MKMTVLPSHKLPPVNRSFFIAITLLILALCGTFKAAQADNQIHWKDVNSGLQEGKSAHKYVLVDIYTDWCGWCKRLDRDTFSNQSLVQFLGTKFVCVKANAEDNGAGQKLTGEYGVNGYPCALVFDPNGKVIGRIVGFKDAQTYEAALTTILNNPSNNN